MRRVLKEKCSIISLCLLRAYGEVRVFTSHSIFHILIKLLGSKLLPVNYSLLILRLSVLINLAMALVWSRPLEKKVAVYYPLLSI